MAEVILYSVYVESVTYDSSQKDNKGGKVDLDVYKRQAYNKP